MIYSVVINKQLNSIWIISDKSAYTAGTNEEVLVCPSYERALMSLATYASKLLPNTKLAEEAKRRLGHYNIDRNYAL